MEAELNYARPSRRSWPMKKGTLGDSSQLKENLDQRITSWQREVDLKRMKSIQGAHVRTPDKDELSEDCVCDGVPSPSPQAPPKVLSFFRCGGFSG